MFKSTDNREKEKFDILTRMEAFINAERIRNDSIKFKLE